MLLPRLLFNPLMMLCISSSANPPLTLTVCVVSLYLFIPTVALFILSPLTFCLDSLDLYGLWSYRWIVTGRLADGLELTLVNGHQLSFLMGGGGGEDFAFIAN